MAPIHEFSPGDFLIFQLESGYALLRVIDSERIDDEQIWHVAAYRDLFLDPDAAEAAVQTPDSLHVEIRHVAITNRAFESTQVAKLGNSSLTVADTAAYADWKNSGSREVHDRSIRLLLGLR